MAQVTEAASLADFDNTLSQAASNLVVVHFWANWAPQCQQMNDVIQELAKDTKLVNTRFVKLEAEEVPEVSEKYEISAVPTFVFIKNKTVVDRLDGANVPVFTKKVQEHSSLLSGAPVTITPPTQENLNERLEKLIRAAPVMMFMKGNPETPRCGFSKQMTAILKEQEVKFSSFDILSDEEIRQGLKKYSNWPTYPQLYVNGELLGGLDIVKELIESGEFKSQLPTQESLEDRLKGLVKKAPVVLFMKGNPDTPRCGFSKTTVAILNDTGVKYETFDILQDEEVRQGLKKFSNWPTYPQLYVNGDLVGGLDIIKELQEAGELEGTLKAQ